MPGHGQGSIFTNDYRRQCFDAWFLGGRPTQMPRIRELMPVNERTGTKPSPAVIKRWMINDLWNERADEMDAKAMIIADDSVLAKKAEIIKLHQLNAAALAAKAFEFLISGTFDSSAAAVNTYFKSTEEVRKMASFSDLIEKLGQMGNDDLMKEIVNRINRGAENDQIIDAEESDEDSDEEE